MTLTRVAPAPAVIARRSLSRGAVVPLLSIVFVGCSATEAARSLRGESAPVAWEATDIRQASEDHGRLVRWDYMLTLRNAGQAGLSFTKLSSGVITPGEFWGALREEPFTHRLDPGAEVRVTGSYSHWCRDCDSGYAETVFRQGVTRVLVYEGTDDQGRPVKITVRIPFHRGVGTSTMERQPEAGPVGRYHGMLNYYPDRSPNRRYPIENVGVNLEKAGNRVSGEIMTSQNRGPIQATLSGDDLSGDFSLAGVTCRVAGTVSGGGSTITGTFECATGEAGSWVLNRM